MAGPEVSSPVLDGSLKTVAPLLSDEEVPGLVHDLKTVAPLAQSNGNMSYPDVPVSGPKSGLVRPDLAKPAIPTSAMPAPDSSGSLEPAPTFRVATRSVEFVTPEQLHRLGRQLAAQTFKVPLLTRFGVQSTPDGSAIEHVTMVATEVPGTRLMVVEWVRKELRLWQVEPVEYGGIGPDLAPGLEASLSVTPVLEAWKRERSRLDRQPRAFVSDGVLPKCDLPRTFGEATSFPALPWPTSFGPSAISSKSQSSVETPTPGTISVAGLAGHGFRVDWFARPDRSPLAVVQTLEEDPLALEEVVFDALTLEVLGVHLPGQTQSSLPVFSEEP
ncbi:MAG: hypothetical protein VKP72_10705 [bacterium]|nr:hypothetical protein [bacterium]